MQADVVFLSRLLITRHLIGLAAPQIAFLSHLCHPVRVYYSCGAADLRVFGVADSHGDGVSISTQTADLLTPQALNCTCKNGEMKAYLLSWKPHFHPLYFVFTVQQRSSEVQQRHFVDQEGWKLHFSLTVAEHVRASSVRQRRG